MNVTTIVQDRECWQTHQEEVCFYKINAELANFVHVHQSKSIGKNEKVACFEENS